MIIRPTTFVLFVDFVIFMYLLYNRSGLPGPKKCKVGKGLTTTFFLPNYEHDYEQPRQISLPNLSAYVGLSHALPLILIYYRAHTRNL